MFYKRLLAISLISLSASTIGFGNVAFSQTVNQEINGSAVGPDTYVNGSNLTINPTGTLNQLINCEARNDGVPVDPRCDASNTAIYGSSNKPPNRPPGDHHHGGHNNNLPGVNQTVTNGGTNTTVITPTTANSSSNSRSDASSTSNSNATITDSGNSRNTNLNFSQGGNAKIGDVNSSSSSQGGSAKISDVNNASSSQVGDQKNQQSVTTGANTISPNVSPSTRVRVDGDQYNSIQFGAQAPGTGGEAFSFQYRSACGTAVNYRQGFALKPRRIGGGGFGYALDISNTEIDTIENRSSVQKKMEDAFGAAINVVNTQQEFQRRLNTGAVSRQEAETFAIGNCAPQYAGVSNTNTQGGVQVTNINKPRTCTARGCN
jgi:hypothetical protein